jgi:hypothetical protein
LQKNVKVRLYLSLPVAFYIKLPTLTILPNGKHLVCYHCKSKFNNLPPNIRSLFSDVKRFKLEIGKYLHLKFYYTLEEYYNSRKAYVHGKRIF